MFGSLFEKLNHLQVNKIAASFAKGMIPVATSDGSSGETMIIPAACAMALKDDPFDPIVYVLEPSDLLPSNASESLKLLVGEENTNLIGWIAAGGDDEPSRHPENRIIFMTVEYALASGILGEGNNFILDEAHDTSMDLSLAKAYLHARRKRGDLVNVAVLSATIDIANEMEYWGDDAVHFTTQGSSHPVTMIHRPDGNVGESVLDLIKNHGRKGILVFVSGQEEIHEATTDITETLFAAYQSMDNIEMATIHGGSNGAERRIASQNPSTDIKILIGTNVLESGISLPWVDGGVSSGDTKIMYVNGNVRNLKKEHLPAWRIRQQIGRCGRFKPGVFILAHSVPIEGRPNMAAPDIVRLPLTELVMHCAAFPDIHIRELEFTKREQPKHGALESAIAWLVDYGLIVEDDEGSVFLTQDGQMIQNLPISYQAAVATCEAVRMGKLAEILPLIAMIDIGDLRFSYRNPMIGSSWNTSDLVQQIMVIAQYFAGHYNLPKIKQRDAEDYHNVSGKKLKEYLLLLRDLEDKTGTIANFDVYLDAEYGKESDAFDKMTKTVIFRALMKESYPFMNSYVGVRIPAAKQHDGTVFTSARPSQFTITKIDPRSTVFCSGNVRVVTPKVGLPFAVVERITAYSADDIAMLRDRFGEAPLSNIASISGITPSLLGEILAPKYNQEVADDDDDDVTVGDFNNLMSSMTKKVIPPIQNKPSAPEVGTLGNILAAALAGKK